MRKAATAMATDSTLLPKIMSSDRYQTILKINADMPESTETPKSTGLGNAEAGMNESFTLIARR